MAAVKRHRPRRVSAKSSVNRSIVIPLILLILTAVVVVVMLFVKQGILADLPVPVGDRDLYKTHENKDQGSYDDSPGYGKRDRDYLDKIIKNH